MSAVFLAILDVGFLSIEASLRPQRPHIYNLGRPICLVDSGSNLSVEKIAGTRTVDLKHRESWLPCGPSVGE